MVYQKSVLKETDKEWEKIPYPLWIIHGDKDTFDPVSISDYTKKNLVNAKSVEIKIVNGARHFIPKEHYEEIKSVLLNLQNERGFGSTITWVKRKTTSFVVSF